MKKIVICLMAGIVMTACTPAEKPAETTESKITLPYTAPYSSSTQDVSDQDLLTVLNSYKAWETGDMAALRATLSDSVYLRGWDGERVDGTADELMKRWTSSRDSLRSVSIKMDAWVKTHFIDRNEDFISVWYRQIDTYKNGNVDTIFWHDVNMVVKGKIRWYSQYRQEAPKK